MEGVADADTGGGAREKRTRGDTGDRDGPARIGCASVKPAAGRRATSDLGCELIGERTEGPL